MKELNLPQKVRDILDNFIQRLKNIYQDGLISLILYGSAASGEFVGKHSNINLLAVLSDTGLENLRKISGIVNKHRFEILTPLFLTEDYIKRSLDVFPIEFLDIKENYIVLYGRDVLKNLEIETKNLRFQCEQELKAKLINIKNIYLKNTKDKRALSNLLFKSSTSIVHILRNLVRLKGRRPSYLKGDVLNEISMEFDIDTANFKKILEAKQKNLHLKYEETESLLFSLVRDLEKIIDKVDKL